MRITGGVFARHSLRSPRGTDTRPTTDRVRESLFAHLQSKYDLEGAYVIDLFAGTGSLGFEALSRGAAHVTFVEKSAAVLRVIKENVTDLGVTEQIKLVKSDVFKWLESSRNEQADFIFADPPYMLPNVTELIDHATPRLTQDGALLLEHDTRHSFEDDPRIAYSKEYGRTVISIFYPES